MFIIRLEAFLGAQLGFDGPTAAQEVGKLSESYRGFHRVGALGPDGVVALGNLVLIVLVPNFPEIAVNLEGVSVGDHEVAGPPGE